MSDNLIPIYLDEKSREVSISQGIGGQQGDWVICRRRTTGSLERIKTVPPIPCEHKDMAIKTLEAYAAKKKWRLKERRERW